MVSKHKSAKVVNTAENAGTKTKALDATISQIERQYGKGAIMRLGEGATCEDVGVIPTGSIGLDNALGIGGVPRGRVIEVFGPESSGKTRSSCTS